MIRLSLGAYLDSLSTFATVALTFLLMIALLRLARWLLEKVSARSFSAHIRHMLEEAQRDRDGYDRCVSAMSRVGEAERGAPSARMVPPQTDAEASPTVSAVAGGEHSGARLGDENGYLGTGLR